jgi:hypothetical protein
MKIWTVVINGENSYVEPTIDFDTGKQMEGDESLAAELNELIPNLNGWNDHIVISYRAAATEPVIDFHAGSVRGIDNRDMAFPSARSWR